MNAAFADTFYFLALLNPRDDFHERAHGLPRHPSMRIVTTRAVLLEVGDAFADPSTRAVAAEFLGSLEDDPAITIVPLADDLYAEGLRLYAGRPDKSWSLTDCVSFTVMRRHDLTDALTGDHHFQQAGFTILLG